MEFSKRTKQFNQELIFGEVGGLIGGPLISLIVALLGGNPGQIAFSAVLGSLMFSAIFWIFLRVRNKKGRGEMTLKHFAGDLAYFTPVASATAFLIYQPILFFLSHALLIRGRAVLFSVISAQLVAFFTFLIIVNLYRQFLIRLLGKKL